MKTRVDTPALKIIRVAADKLGLRCDQPDDLKLCEVKSTGGYRLEREKHLYLHCIESISRTNDLQRQ